MTSLKKRRRIRLVLAAVAMLALSSVFVGYALRDGIRYFRTPTEVAAASPAPHETFRIGGMVETGSLKRQGTQVQFRVSDGETAIAVVYDGITPDLFAEGEGVVATGRLEGGRFFAHEILAKHDESYMPRELAGTMAGLRQ